MSPAQPAGTIPVGGSPSGSPNAVPSQPSTLPGTVPNISGLLTANDMQLRSGFVNVTWSGFLALQQKGMQQAARATEIRHAVCQKLAKEMESYARANAPWNDRTGDARSGLEGTYIAESGKFQSSAEIGHTVDYGVFLETMQGGRFAIILPTLLYFASHLQGIEEEFYAEGK